MTTTTKKNHAEKISRIIVLFGKDKRILDKKIEGYFNTHEIDGFLLSELTDLKDQILQEIN